MGNTRVMIKEILLRPNDGADPVDFRSRGQSISPRLALRMATQDAHTRLEQNACMRRLMDIGVTVNDYALVLQAFAAWHGPLERLLSDLPLIDPDANARQSKAQWLTADLLALTENFGIRLPETSAAAGLGLERPADTPALLGMAYVVEGATLGGEIISRHLKKCLSPDMPMQFFTSYGAERSIMWQRFQKLLDGHIFNQARLQQAISAANAAFSSLDHWLGRQPDLTLSGMPKTLVPS
jgi:heme oxygenase